MISQKTKTQIAHAYGFKHKGMFLKLLEMEEINLPEHGLLNQDIQIDLYARMGLPKGLEAEDTKVAAVAVEKYCKKRGLSPPIL